VEKDSHKISTDIETVKLIITKKIYT